MEFRRARSALPCPDGCFTGFGVDVGFSIAIWDPRKIGKLARALTGERDLEFVGDKGGESDFDGELGEAFNESSAVFSAVEVGGAIILGTGS